MGGELAGGTPFADEMFKPNTVRGNGFQAPLDPLQVLSWVIISMLVASFCLLLFPMIPDPWSVIALVVYLLALGGVLASGYMTGRCDPIDPYVSASEEELDKLSGLLKCNACRSRVNRLSRHCLICDKCVVDYDHHCKWLNNCIGEANYKPFICLLASTLLLVASQLVTSAGLFITYVGNMDQLTLDLDASSLELQEEAFLGLVGANIFMGIPACMMVAHLVCFHIYLAYYGLTTYNYVMQMQAAEEAKHRAKTYENDEETSSDEDTEEESVHGGDSAPEEDAAPDEKALPVEMPLPPQMQDPEMGIAIPISEQKACPIIDEKSVDDAEKVCVQANSIPGQLDADDPASSRRGPVRLAPIDGAPCISPAAGNDLPKYTPK